jgi:hypothetical protein
VPPPSRSDTTAQRRKKLVRKGGHSADTAALHQSSHQAKAARKADLERRVCARYRAGASLAELVDEFRRRPSTLYSVLIRHRVELREETRQEIRDLGTAGRHGTPRATVAGRTPPDSGGASLKSDAATAMQHLLRGASPDELREIVQLANLTPQQEEDPGGSPWGPPPSPDQLADAVLANTRKSFAARREIEQDSLSRADVAAALGTSATAITDRLEAGKLVGLKRGREWLIPSWQLHADSKDGLLPGLSELVSAFPGGPVSLSRWVKKPTVDLDGETPLAALTKARVDEVVRMARQLSAAGW